MQTENKPGGKSLFTRDVGAWGWSLVLILGAPVGVMCAVAFMGMATREWGAAIASLWLIALLGAAGTMIWAIPKTRAPAAAKPQGWAWALVALFLVLVALPAVWRAGTRGEWGSLAPFFAAPLGFAIGSGLRALIRGRRRSRPDAERSTCDETGPAP